MPDDRWNRVLQSLLHDSPNSDDSSDHAQLQNNNHDLHSKQDCDNGHFLDSALINSADERLNLNRGRRFLSDQGTGRQSIRKEVLMDLV